MPGSIFCGIWQRFRDSRTNNNDIPLLDGDTTITSQENGHTTETTFISRSSNEVETIPFQKRQNSRDSAGRERVLDPCNEEDENDPQLPDNDDSIDHL